VGVAVIDRMHDGTRYYVCCAYYQNEAASKRAWERIQSQMMPGPDTGLGVVRLAPHPKQGDPNLLVMGAPRGKWCVAAVTHSQVTATAVELLMRGGIEFSMNPAFADALIARSIQQRQALVGVTGRVIHRRHPHRGATIDERGHVHEVDDG
jgi:hypothetical protein